LDSEYLNARPAYYAHRASLNARHRYNFALLVTLVSAAFLAAYLYFGIFELTFDETARGSRSLPLLWLMLSGIIGRLMGSYPHSAGTLANARREAAWMSSIMIGAAWLGYIDAYISDISGYCVLLIPMSVLSSSGRLQSILLFGLPCVVTLALVTMNVPASIDKILFMFNIAVISGGAIYISRNLEATRKTDFMAHLSVREKGQQLNTLNLQLAHRQNQLAFTNSRLEEQAAELEEANQTLNKRALELEQLNRRLEEQAMTDPLTGIANRRRVFNRLSLELARHKRHGTSCAVAIIDLDHFGRFNKQYGVLAGDAVLKEFAGMVSSHVRALDTVARYGGEEFIVVMPESDSVGANNLIERIRCQTETAQLTSRKLTVTFSAGVTEISETDDSIEEALERADQALRLAKELGRNQVQRA